MKTNEYINKYMRKDASMGKPKAIIYDLEGTLSDHRHRIHHWENKDYDEYNRLFLMDPCNEMMVSRLKENSEQFVTIIVTAKEHCYENDVWRWLNDYNLGQHVTETYYRNTGDKRPSVVVKEEILNMLLNKFDIIKAYDDREDICRMYNQYGIAWERIVLPVLEKVKDSTPASNLRKAADLFESKNAEYGDAYLKHGKIMAELFPDGLTLSGAEDFAKFHLFELDIIKSNRIASAFLKGSNHPDSWDDKMVYAAMGKETCNE